MFLLFFFVAFIKDAVRNWIFLYIRSLIKVCKVITKVVDLAITIISELFGTQIKASVNKA